MPSRVRRTSTLFHVVMPIRIYSKENSGGLTGITQHMVSLTKIVEGRSAIIDTLLGQEVVRCPLCEQTYRFGYSKDEWYKVSAWLCKAGVALRESHQTDKHEQRTLQLIWRTGINR
jgi:hypothetical protein